MGYLVVKILQDIYQNINLSNAGILKETENRNANNLFRLSVEIV